MPKSTVKQSQSDAASVTTATVLLPQPPPAAPALPTISERLAAGKALRDTVPRSSHSEWQPLAQRSDPMAVLEASNRGRLPDLLPLRYGRMLTSPFAFLRGAASIMAADLAHTPSTKLHVQACGDCHLANFGAYGTPERQMVFDVNDFDETLPAPWEWDLKRLATSVVVAGRYLHLPDKTNREATLSVVRAYREHMQTYAAMTFLEVWYAHISVESLLHGLPSPKAQKSLKAELHKAQHLTPVLELAKSTTVTDGQRRFVDNPPLVFHPSPDDPLAAELLAVFHQYRPTLRDDWRVLLDHYHVVDTAIKVVGVGSVGTRCGVALLVAGYNDPLFLQIKEARPSVLAPYVSQSRYEHQGHRVISGQHLMQAASDIFLGWARSDSGRDYYVRQLRDLKASVVVEGMTAPDLSGYAALCGWALARAHARSGDRLMISGYLGQKDTVDQAIATFALAYADQTEQDYQKLVAAVKAGQIEAVTL